MHEYTGEVIYHREVHVTKEEKKKKERESKIALQQLKEGNKWLKSFKKVIKEKTA